MPQITVDSAQLISLAGVIRAVLRFIRRLAFVGLLGVAAVGALLARDGFTVVDGVITVLLLAPPAVLLLFAQGIRELLALPERFRRMPQEGQERVSELTRLAGQARTTRLGGMPLLLWRLRGTVGSLRDVAGIAVPFRVLTPGFLGLALLGALACVVLAGLGVIALIVLAVA